MFININFFSLFQPNGRFETNKKICLSISGHHPETWQPSWSIRTALLALIAFMSSPGNGAIGSLDYTPEERKLLAKKSRNWECPECGKIVSLLSSSKSKPVTQEESDMINRIKLKAEENAKKDPNYDLVDEEITNVLKDVSDLKGSEPKGNDTTNPARQQNEQENIQVSSENNNLRGLMWAVIAAIVLLVARRIFLML